MTWWLRWGSSVRCGPGSQPGRVRDSDPCSDRYICLSPDSPSHWHGHGPSRPVLPRFASDGRTFCAESRCPSRVVYAVRVALSESHRPSRHGAVPTILSVRVARRHQRPGTTGNLNTPSGRARRRPMLAVHQMYFVV